MNEQVLRTIGIVLGLVLSLPLLVILYRFARFLSRIESSTENTEVAVSRINELLMAHDRDIVNIKAQLRYGRRATDTQVEGGLND